jgi:Uma2 family endonuclease
VGGPRPWRCTPSEFEKLCQAGFFLGSRYQLIRGEIIDMGREGPQHYTMMVLIVELLKTVFGPGHYVRPGGSISLTDSRPQPDAAVVPGSARDYLNAHPATALLAVEVAETSLAYDLSTKAELYATAGIPEYWVVDLEGRQLHVFRDPAPLAEGLEATTYGTHLTLASGEMVTPLHAAKSVSVSDLLP